MPRLNAYRLTEEPINIVARQCIDAFSNAVDLDGIKINQSVDFGLDSIFNDVLQGGANSTPAQFPMMRIWYSNITRDLDDGRAIIAYSDVTLWLYFLYYVGVPSDGSPLFSFVAARENHIRTCLERMRMDVNVPIKDTTNGDISRLLPQSMVEDHDTPLKYIDGSIVLSPEFACSRVDLSYRVKGYIAL
jgi:hypothetical protein